MSPDNATGFPLRRLCWEPTLPASLRICHGPLPPGGTGGDPPTRPLRSARGRAVAQCPPRIQRPDECSDREVVLAPFCGRKGPGQNHRSGAGTGGGQVLGVTARIPLVVGPPQVAPVEARRE